MANNTGKEKSLICSFCGKSQDEVDRMIIGPGVNICNECIELCHSLLDNDEKPSARPQSGKASARPAPEKRPLINILTPAEIKAGLDQYVIGQDAAKTVLAVSVYNHYKRILSGKSGDDVELQKSNVLLLGPSGVGKTLLAQTLARMLGVPFAIADATTLTEAGYVGEDVENILLKLIQAADFDVQKAEIGIIYIDEIDKITRKSEKPLHHPRCGRRGCAAGAAEDPGGYCQQCAAAGRPQASPAGSSSRSTPRTSCLSAAVRSMAWKSRSSAVPTPRPWASAAQLKDTSASAKQKLLNKVEPHDLVKFGLIPELIGRLPVITVLDALDEDALVRILKEPKNSLVKQYTALFRMDNVELEFTDEALRAIARKTIERKSGARGLRSVVENLLIPVMYQVPSDPTIIKVIVDESTVEGQPPRLEYGAVRKRYKSLASANPV